MWNNLIRGVGTMKGKEKVLFSLLLLSLLLLFFCVKNKKEQEREIVMKMRQSC